MEEKIYDLIIVGGGPAGMTAGIYAARLRLKTLLITKNFGGQVASKAVAIENYPGFESIFGPELVKKMEKHLKGQEVDTELGEVVDINKKDKVFSVLTKDKKTFLAFSVILATGAQARSLNIPGEKEFIGKGVSYCSVCDGPLFRNKDVAIIGGGNAGFETAIFLLDIAKKIYILEYSDQIKAFESNQKIIENSDKTQIITQARLKEIRGLPTGRQGDKFVNLLVYEDRKTSQEKNLEVQGVFIEVGYQPVVCCAKDLIDLNELGEIKVNPETCQTKTEGLYAAGDVNDGKFKQIVAAAGEAAKAVLSAHSYIKHRKIEK